MIERTNALRALAERIGADPERMIGRAGKSACVVCGHDHIIGRSTCAWCGATGMQRTGACVVGSN